MSEAVRSVCAIAWFVVSSACSSIPSKASTLFESDDEGWLIAGNGETTRPTFKATGGNPNGNLCATDADPSEFFYFVAPGKYLGAVSDVMGKVLTFDLKINQQFNLQRGRDVVLNGGGLSLVKRFDAAPGTDWTPRKVGFDASSGWIVEGTNQPATEDDLGSVLRNLTALRIRGEFVDGPQDTACLDNVYFGSPP